MSIIYIVHKEKSTRNDFVSQVEGKYHVLIVINQNIVA